MGAGMELGVMPSLTMVTKGILSQELKAAEVWRERKEGKERRSRGQ